MSILYYILDNKNNHCVQSIKFQNFLYRVKLYVFLNLKIELHFNAL